MRLPAVNEAEVPQAKIVLYRLNTEHRAGKGKARFFSGHGFAPEPWLALAEALRQHAREKDVIPQEQTALTRQYGDETGGSPGASDRFQCPGNESFQKGQTARG